MIAFPTENSICLPISGFVAVRPVHCECSHRRIIRKRAQKPRQINETAAGKMGKAKARNLSDCVSFCKAAPEAVQRHETIHRLPKNTPQSTAIDRSSQIVPPIHLPMVVIHLALTATSTTAPPHEFSPTHKRRVVADTPRTSSISLDAHLSSRRQCQLHDPACLSTDLTARAADGQLDQRQQQG